MLATFQRSAKRSRSHALILILLRVRHVSGLHSEESEMADKNSRYKDWSHESLLERVEYLEKQLKAQTGRLGALDQGIPVGC